MIDDCFFLKSKVAIMPKFWEKGKQKYTSYCAVLSLPWRSYLTGYKRRVGENSEKHQHKTFKSFDIFETTIIVQDFLWRWWEAVLFGRCDYWWSEGIHPYTSFPGKVDYDQLGFLYSTLSFNKRFTHNVLLGSFWCWFHEKRSCGETNIGQRSILLHVPINKIMAPSFA